MAALLCSLGVQSTAAPLPDDSALCHAAIENVAGASQIPDGLLTAISVVESGRWNSRTRTVTAWPWTVNIGDDGHYLSSKAEAIATVEAARAAGFQSIDVGCMQINLRAHPQAFTSLEDAFDPSSNVRYATVFLLQLFHSTGNWPTAIQDYHSSTLVIGTPYVRKVGAVWPRLALYGGPNVSSTGMTSADQQLERAAPVDPYMIMTPQFRAQLVKDAEFRRARDAKMGLLPLKARSEHVASGLPPLQKPSRRPQRQTGPLS